MNKKNASTGKCVIKDVLGLYWRERDGKWVSKREADVFNTPVAAMVYIDNRKTTDLNFKWTNQLSIEMV